MEREQKLLIKETVTFNIYCAIVKKIRNILDSTLEERQIIKDIVSDIINYFQGSDEYRTMQSVLEFNKLFKGYIVET